MFATVTGVGGAPGAGGRWQPLFEDHGIALALMGIFVVFAALILVASFIVLLPRLMRAVDRLHPVEQEKRLGQPPVDADDDIPAETVAVIAAAVAATVTGPHRVVRIRGLTPEDLGWSLEGRMQHHTSHRIQRR